VADPPLRNLRLCLAIADDYLTYARGMEVWSLFYLAGFLQLVHDQSAVTIDPSAAAQLQTAARELYDQIERWGG
jgi:hypothetical protein